MAGTNRTTRAARSGTTPPRPRRTAADAGRVACVDLPAFPLQLLHRRDPDARTGPAAIVDRDHPQGKILWANPAARDRRVLPGQRYSAALSLCPGLRAAEVPIEEIAAGVAAITELLRRFSPEVEPAREEPGVFWLDAGGLVHLHPSLLEWGERLQRALVADGFTASVIVGCSRFGAYALARAAGEGAWLLGTLDEERAATRRVPLARLGIEPRFRDALSRLGVHTIGELAELPEGGLSQRFGKEAERLHRLATGSLSEPLTPALPVEPPVRRVAFEMPETDLRRLLYALEQEVPGLLAEIAERRQALAGLALRMELDGASPRRIEVRPATPTLVGGQILELLRLQLQNGSWLRAGITAAVLTARGVPARAEQLRLFRENPRRDLRAAARALARVRAEIGPYGVVAARLTEGHLPEATFTWEPLDTIRFPERSVRRDDRPAALVRRVFARPTPLPPRPRHEPDGWLLSGLACGPVRQYVGPYIVSGGWWARPPGDRDAIHREYHFAETARGDLLWVFHDRRRRRWFLQGAVE